VGVCINDGVALGGIRRIIGKIDVWFADVLLALLLLSASHKHTIIAMSISKGY
jgi:hypothetical protein